MASLAALVPGAMEGLVREVIVADGGSRDDTATVADVAGCNFTVIEGTLGRRLKTAATTARAPWLLFLRPGTVPEAGWIGEVRRFVERPPPDARAAVFRRGRAARPALTRGAVDAHRQRSARCRVPNKACSSRIRFYDELGGHPDLAADPEADLIRRIGRRRVLTLAAGCLVAAQILD